MTVTDDEMVRLAEEMARTLSRCWGDRHDWRELFGACWEGVRRAARNPEAGSRLLRRAANHAAITYLRAMDAGGWGRPNGRKHSLRPLASVQRTRIGGDDGGVYGTLEPASFDRPNPDRRMLSLWCEHRAQRLCWPLRDRVMLYLYTVEGMSLKEVGAAVGVPPQSVQYRLHRYCGAAGTILRGQRIGDSRRTR